MASCLARPCAGPLPQAAAPALKPPTPGALRLALPRACSSRRALLQRCAAAASQLEGVTTWLAAAGVDVGKQAAAPGADGSLVTTRPVAKGEQLFAIPESAWITPAIAAQSEIGQYLVGLEPWLVLSLFLLHERAKVPASRYGPYLAALPADSGSPVQWSDGELADLAGSQVLGTVQGYRAYFQQRFEQLQAEVFAPNPAAFDPSVFTYDAFVWAASTVRGRVHPPLDGANIALVPLADMTQHQRSAGNAGWRLKSVGLFGGGSGRTLVLEAGEALAAGAPVAMDFGPSKTDGQLLVDHGVLDPLISQASYALTLELNEAASNFGDKIDILELNELQQSMEFVLRVDSPPGEAMLAMLRLLQLQGADSFLLESIFRNETWEHMQLPVSEENERACYQVIIDGCTAALAGYPTSIDEDLALLASGSLPPGSRQQRAVRVRLGEKEALDVTLRYFEERIDRLAGMEYYGERRLKRLGLLDDGGNSTWDGFFEDGIA